MEDYDFRHPRVYDVKELKEWAKYLGEGVKKEGKDPKSSKVVRNFFSDALQAYYNPPGIDFDVLSTNAGHILYRLSDFVSEKERKNIPIYPNDKGTLIMKMYKGNVQWDSLDDWRKSWEKDHPVIPNFIKKLPSAFKLLEK